MLTVCLVVVLNVRFGYCNNDFIKKRGGEKKNRIGMKNKNNGGGGTLLRRHKRDAIKIPYTNTCTNDSDCILEKKCRSYHCVAGEDGDACNKDSDCKSDKCKAWPIWGKCIVGYTCHSGLKDGESCCRDNDCTADYCNSFGKCGGIRKAGEECEVDEDCIDGDCDYEKKCAGKKEESS